MEDTTGESETARCREEHNPGFPRTGKINEIREFEDFGKMKLRKN
jgi:hypothetical protein